MKIYQWHKDNWDQLINNHDNLPHALIFHGPADSGINSFAAEICKKLVCNAITSGHTYCNECHNCNWFDSQAHPDILIINNNLSDEGKVNIIVDSIRELKEFFEFTAHQKDGRKIALINDAHQLNKSAANALLKILEEPPNYAIIILTTSELGKILPTIRSRSRLIRFFKPNLDVTNNYLSSIDKEELLSFISLYGGNPIALVNDLENKSTLTEIITSLRRGGQFDLSSINNGWLDKGIPWIINLIQKWSYEILLTKLTECQYYFPSEKSNIETLAKKADLKTLLKFHKKLMAVKLYSSAPVNKEINLDLIFFDYREIFI